MQADALPLRVAARPNQVVFQEVASSAGKPFAARGYRDVRANPPNQLLQTDGLGRGLAGVVVHVHVVG